MAKVNYGWLKTYNDEYFAPKTILSQLHTDEGTLLEDFLDNSYLKLSEGGELEGPLLLARDPEVDKEAATKKYVDEKTVLLAGLTASIEELNYTDGVTSSIQTQLDDKAPLASPALIGTPTAPTAAAGTNTTQVATTAFVQAAINNAIIAAMEAVY